MHSSAQFHFNCEQNSHKRWTNESMTKSSVPLHFLIWIQRKTNWVGGIEKTSNRICPSKGCFGLEQPPLRESFGKKKTPMSGDWVNRLLTLIGCDICILTDCCSCHCCYFAEGLFIHSYPCFVYICWFNKYDFIIAEAVSYAQRNDFYLPLNNLRMSFEVGSLAALRVTESIGLRSCFGILHLGWVIGRF